MSSTKAGQPKRLAAKLKQLRLKLDLTQEGMLQALKNETPDDTVLHLGYITRYEAGTRVPALLVLLAYSRVCKTTLEALVDDNHDVI